MYRIKWLAMFLACVFLITACGETQKKSEVMLYKPEKDTKQQEHYKTTKVKKDTYEEKISTTGSLYYQDEKAISINDSRAYLDKICVKENQKIKKGDVLAIYHVKYSDISMEKKKLEVEQARAEFDTSLNGKRNEVLEKQRSIKNLTNESEIKIAKIQLQRLKREYKDIQKTEKDILKQERNYQALVQKRKSATLRSKYSGIAGDVVSVGEIGEETVTGDTLMVIRDEKNFLIQAEDGAGMRYNMTLDIGLGSTPGQVKHHIKGQVISTDNLMGGEGGFGESEEASSQLIKISEQDRKKYDFKKYNIFISGVSMRVEDALIIDAKAVQEEIENEQTKLFVYLVEKGKLHKRYIVSNYKQETYYLVNQGLEEGQTLAILSK